MRWVWSEYAYSSTCTILLYDFQFLGNSRMKVLWIIVTQMLGAQIRTINAALALH